MSLTELYYFGRLEHATTEKEVMEIVREAAEEVVYWPSIGLRAESRLREIHARSESK